MARALRDPWVGIRGVFANYFENVSVSIGSFVLHMGSFFKVSGFAKGCRMALLSHIFEIPRVCLTPVILTPGAWRSEGLSSTC